MTDYETEEFMEKQQKLAEFLLDMATGLSWSDAEGVDDFHSNYMLDANDILMANPHLLGLTTREAMGLDDAADASSTDEVWKPVGFGWGGLEVTHESVKPKFSEIASDDIYDIPAEEQEQFFKAQAEAVFDTDDLTRELIMGLAHKLDLPPHELLTYPIVDDLPTVIERWCCEGKSCGNVLLSLREYVIHKEKHIKLYDYVRANGGSYTHDRRSKESMLIWLNKTKNNINKE